MTGSTAALRAAETRRVHPATGRLLVELTGGSQASVATLFRGRVEASPEARFLSWRGRWWSYLEALEHAERVAGFLRECGAAGPECRVASYLENCPEALWTWFGTQLAGSVYVPLNRSHRGRILTDMLRRSLATVLVTDREGADRIERISDTSIRDVVLVDEVSGSLDGVATVAYSELATMNRWSGVVPDPHALGTVMFTSGSTGRSKAVLVAHNQQPRGAALVAEAFGLRATDVWHAWPPLFHILGQLYVVLASVASGGGVALQPRFSRSGFWREVRETGSTVIGGMASVMRLLWTLEDDELATDNPARLALVSGAFADLHRSFEERYQLSIVDCFGMTEAEPVTLPLLGGVEPGSHGLPSRDFDIRIVDDEDNEVDAESVGEIVVRPRGPSLIFRGYEGDDEQTVRAWRNLWFHTGDLGYLDEQGFLHYLDRRRHGIRRLGENISVWELEELLNAAPGVAMAVAVGVDGEPGEQDVKVVVVPDPRAALTEAALHEWCEGNMARFMVPRYIEFRTELPRITIGKVDRTHLANVDSNVWDARAGGADGRHRRSA